MIIILPLILVLRKMKAGYKLQKNITSINHFLFIDDFKMYGANRDQLDSLVLTVRISPENIQMSSGLDKCAVSKIKRGRKVSNTGIKFQDDQHIGEVRIGEYKYLGILQLDQILHTRIKGVIT